MFATDINTNPFSNVDKSISDFKKVQLALLIFTSVSTLLLIVLTIKNFTKNG